MTFGFPQGKVAIVNRWGGQCKAIDTKFNKDLIHSKLLKSVYSKNKKVDVFWHTVYVCIYIYPHTHTSIHTHSCGQPVQVFADWMPYLSPNEQDQNAEWHKKIPTIEARWLNCVECPQYSTRLKALGYLCDCKWACPKMTSGQSNLT